MADQSVHLGEMSREDRLRTFADHTVAAARDGSAIILTISLSLWLSENASEEEWTTEVLAAADRAGVPHSVIEDNEVIILISVGGGYFMQPDPTTGAGNLFFNEALYRRAIVAGHQPEAPEVLDEILDQPEGQVLADEVPAPPDEQAA